MGVLAVQVPEGGLLGALAPLGLGASAGTALVVDLDPAGPRYPGEGTLAELVEDGPRLADLRPERTGLAVLRNGGVGAEAAGEIVAALAREWPQVVVRLAPGAETTGGFPVLRVYPLVPGGLFEAPSDGVFQDLGFRLPAPEGAIRLPRLSRAAAGTLLAGTIPYRSSWVRAWSPLWERPWE